jgi:GT2 family glycosyltransferase
LNARISLVILTHNRARELERTLERSIALPERPRIVVVDNASTDGTPRLVGERFPRVTYLRLECNAGAAARNVAVERLSTPYVAFSDDDTVWAPGSLERAVRTLDAHPRLAAVCARVLVGESLEEDPACLEMAASPLPSQHLPGPSLLGFLAGASVFRRVAFMQAGGYEPRFFIGGEESLLALDLAARGWAIVYLDSLAVQHLPSRQRNTGARRRALARNALWVAWLRRPLGSALRQTLGTLREALRDPQAAAGALEALRGLPWALARRRVIAPELEALWSVLERARTASARAARARGAPPRRAAGAAPPA